MPITTKAPVKASAPPSIAFVTPEMAAAWLESNTENRPVRDRHVDDLARDMLAGAWLLTGDPIKFDVRGVLIDGQHRLWAVVNSGVTVPMYVIRDLPTEVRAVLDTGLRRSAGDALGFAGYKTTGRLAATARVIMARDDGYYLNTDDRRRPPSYTNSEVFAFAETHPEIVSFVQRANASYRAIGIKSTALWAYCLWVFDSIDADAGLEFEKSLVELTGFVEGDPRATLLRWLQDTRRTGLHSTVLTPRILFAVFRTWNAWRNKEKLSKIQINDHAQIPTAI